MAVQNLLLYTEVDVNNKLTVTATRATGAAVDADEDVYLYYDFSAGAINDFSVNYEIYFDGASSSNLCSCGIGLTASTINDLSGWQTNDVMARMVRVVGPVYSVYITEGDLSEQDNQVINAATLYYCTLSRAAGGTTVSSYVYSDAARTVQVGATKSITIAGATTYRYFYAACNYNSATGGRDFYGYLQNIEIVSSGVSSVISGGWW